VSPERRFSHIRELMAHTEEGMLAVAPSGLVCVLNERAEEYLGVTRDELLGRPVVCLERPELVGALIEALRSIELFTFECRIDDRVLQCTVASYNEDGGHGAVLTMRDRTQVLQERRQAAAVISSAGDGLVVFDREGRITFLNPAAERMLGRESSDLVRSVVDLWSLFGEQQPRPSATGDVREVHLDQPEPRVIEVRWDQVLDEDGAYIGHVATLRDVTAEREVGRMKNEFVSTVSHELRTPLTSIKGYIDLILDGEAGDINEIQREFLAIVKDNTDRLVDLINDMLDISRIESGRIVLKVRPLDITERIKGALDTFRTVLEKQGRKVNLRVPDDVPHVAADPDRIGQVLVNLISNAIKYSPDGGDIDIVVEPEGDEVRVTISDRGIGILPEEMPRLFTKFYRIDTSLTREIGGTGLGLSIVRSIVELLGGRTGVYSAPDEGSSFWFTLPAAARRIEWEPSAPAPFGEVGGRVLVVDSSQECTHLLERYLVGHGYEVLQAHTTEEAWDRALEHAPDVITLDVMVDDGAGFELLQRLKGHEKTRDIPVVVLSIVCDEGKSHRFGATDYLEKPIDRDRLLAIIDGLVGSIATPKVLVVDDDRSIVDVMCRTLESRGLSPLAAYDGEQALEVVRTSRPDLILLDLKMPVMDGYDVLAALKADDATRDIPVVVMTAYHLDEDRAHVLELAAEQISKPFDAEEFVQRVETVLTREAGA
jgi:PAS domain S-box-containing protein